MAKTSLSEDDDSLPEGISVFAVSDVFLAICSADGCGDVREKASAIQMIVSLAISSAISVCEIRRMTDSLIYSSQPVLSVVALSRISTAPDSSAALIRRLSLTRLSPGAISESKEYTFLCSRKTSVPYVPTISVSTWAIVCTSAIA